MIYLKIDPFYIFSMIIVGLCLIYIVFISVIFPNIKKSKIKKLLLLSASNNNKKIIIINDKTNGNTFKIKIEGKVYNAKLVFVNKNCDLQVNNFETWVIYKKCSDGNYKTKTIPDMTRFMQSKVENKIILLSSKAKTIKKVINECEMIMANPSTNVFGVNVFNYNDYDELFK